MTATAFCTVCQQDTLPLDTGLCGWCLCDPATGQRDTVAQRRERNRLAAQRSRDRKKPSVPVNDRSAGPNPPQVKRPALQEVQL